MRAWVKLLYELFYLIIKQNLKFINLNSFKYYAISTTGRLLNIFSALTYCLLIETAELTQFISAENFTTGITAVTVRKYAD